MLQSNWIHFVALNHIFPVLVQLLLCCVTGVGISVGSIIVTIRVTATPVTMLNGMVITCTDQLDPMSITLTTAGDS